MQRYASVSLFCLALWPFAATAQPAASGNNQQLLGMRLFNQSCRVCHTKPTLLSGQYGPTLSMATLGGNADAMREVVSDGTPRMPGFKYTYKPAEIDAIVAYLKTVPAPAQTQPPAAGNPASSRSAD
jgi:mono/diheme cytochrome c family protein